MLVREFHSAYDNPNPKEYVWVLSEVAESRLDKYTTIIPMDLPMNQQGWLIERTKGVPVNDWTFYSYSSRRYKLINNGDHGIIIVEML